MSDKQIWKVVLIELGLWIAMAFSLSVAAEPCDCQCKLIDGTGGNGGGGQIHVIDMGCGEMIDDHFVQRQCSPTATPTPTARK